MNHIDSSRRNKKIHELAISGIKPIEIARRYNLAKSSVTGILKRLGFSRRDAQQQVSRDALLKQQEAQAELALYSPEKQRIARSLLNSSRTRAWKKGWAFNITLVDILRIIPDYCPVYHTPFVVHTPQTASLDRINNALGYETNNIQVISWRANRLKCDATADEIEKLLNFMRK